MSKTIKSLISEADQKLDMWKEISEDPAALVDRHKTKADALMLVNYFEGRYGALCDAMLLN